MAIDTIIQSSFDITIKIVSFVTNIVGSLVPQGLQNIVLLIAAIILGYFLIKATFMDVNFLYKVLIIWMIFIIFKLTIGGLG